jgi:hypothetical protein
MDLHEKLPPGNYVVKQDPFENLYLEHTEDFEIPAKLYGDTTRNADRIINSFWQRGKSTGVMLVGEKGSGKTLLSKHICVELAKQDVPTIVINSPWHGDKFNTLIQTIEQPAIIMFDEFEKVYDSEEQESLLTLLDGVYASKKLFMLTSNDKWKVDSHMRNRPGRIFYMIDFKGLDAEFIREYCNDNLNDKKHLETIVNISTIFAEFNFDMLKALVEDMNRYNESPQDALRILNIKAEYDSGATYKVEIFRGDRKADRQSPTSWNGTPLTAKDMSVSWYFDGKKKGTDTAVAAGSKPSPISDDEDPNDGWHDNEFGPENLVKFDTKKGLFIYEKEGITVILTREKAKYFNFDAF